VTITWLSTWINDPLWTGESSQYITNPKVNSAFHLSTLAKLTTGLAGWSQGKAQSPYWV